MDYNDLHLTLGRIEAKLESMHEDLLENRARIDTNAKSISDLKHFRSRVRGAATLGGILFAGMSTLLGILAKARGLF